MEKVPNYFLDKRDQFSKEKERNEKRKRGDDLREKDNPYEDSIKEIALAEDAFRDKLAAGDMNKELTDALADAFSDETLKAKEAQKERWEDELTGLRNRTAYNKDIPKMLEMGKRYEQESAFLMIDFDHFKSVNDTYGYKAGDTVLKEIASIVKNKLRASDEIYRYGGEEFLVYLPNTNSVLAQGVAEKIRTAVEDADILIDVNGKDVILKKTISIGCVGTDQIDDWQSSDLDRVMEGIGGRANRALKVSKEDRNTVTVFSEDLPEISEDK